MDYFCDSGRLLNGELALPPYLMINTDDKKFVTPVDPPTSTANVSLRNNKRSEHVNKKMRQREIICRWPSMFGKEKYIS